MPVFLVDDPEHWRARAREMRELAALAEGVAKEELIELAEAYEKLAFRAGNRAAART
jgi:hypothetical protein